MEERISWDEVCGSGKPINPTFGSYRLSDLLGKGFLSFGRFQLIETFDN